MKQHLPVLPADIWECVASFLSLWELLPLISVNRALYNIVLDMKYREIHWDKLDDHMAKTLVRLRTPSVARRVRRLHIRAWFIEYLIRKEAFTPHSYVMSSKRWISQYLQLPPRITPSTGGKSSSAGNILESMTRAVRLMTHVTEYSFEWCDLSPTPEILQFLSAARTTFGVSLRKLVLHAQLGNFATLLTTVDFENLEELELFLDHDHSVGAHCADLLRGCIAPFVNHFRRTLTSLLISSASNVDVVPLLDALQEVPHLHKLVGRFAFDTVHLSDPGGLVKILRTNTDTLSNVELGWSSAAASKSDSDADHQPVPVLSTWADFSAEVVADPLVLANLTSFKLPCLSTFDATLRCLRRSADMLTSLYLVDHFLGDQELTDLVGVFSHRPFDAGLQTLYLGLLNFSIATLDLFANQLPGLQSLGLVLTPTSVAVISDREEMGYPTRYLGGRSYPDWALSNLGIWEKRFIDTAHTVPKELKVMQHLARCIPGLQTFKGEPKSEGKVCRAWLEEVLVLEVVPID